MEQAKNQDSQNPADRPLVTFDTNILYAIRNNEPAAQYARQLLALSRRKLITVNVTLSKALENQRPDEYREMHEYGTWLQEQGIEPENIFTHPRTIGFRSPGDPNNTFTFDPQLELQLNMRVHQILFPNIPFRWYDYRDQECMRLDIVGIRQRALIELDTLRFDIYIPASPQAPAKRPTPALDMLEQTEQNELHTILDRMHQVWMNAKNDALGLYNHLTLAAYTTYPEQAVFVTSDRNFRKRSRLLALQQLGFRGEILPPAEAVACIGKITKVSLEEIEKV